jgi:HEAT repeat protein
MLWYTRGLAGLLLSSSILLLGSCRQSGSNKSIAELTQGLKSQDEAQRISAARALGKVGAADPEASVAALSGALNDESAYVRQTATKSLGVIGPNAQSAVPSLQKALKDPDEGVRLNAAEALTKIRGK